MALNGVQVKKKQRNCPVQPTPAQKLHYWSILNTHGIGLLQLIEKEWLDLLNDTTKTEPDYLRFISEHGSFFFANPASQQYFAIAELRLGTDYRVDYAIPTDKGSYGLQYGLIEIESPHDRTYIKKGVPSANLTEAMQQIANWKSWIKSNRHIAQRLFPSYLWKTDADPVFTYTIVIGRRTDTDEHKDKVVELSKSISVDIRSFDWMTDMLRFRMNNGFRTSIMGSLSPQIRSMPDEIKNAITNPFANALSETEWKSIVKSHRNPVAHFVPAIGTTIAATLRANRRYAEFEALWAGN